MSKNKHKNFHSTTILCLRDDKKVVIIGDGQVSLGDTVIKNTANKIRTLNDGNILTGFAGATADAFTLFNKLEEKLRKHSNNLIKSSIELTKDWRMNTYLRKLESMIIVADRKSTLILSGNGDILEPEDGIAAIGSGGNYALAAAKALINISSMDLEEKAKKSMQIASNICIYTNQYTFIKKIIM